MSRPEDTGQTDFEEFVAARYASLVRTAYHLTGNAHDAEDLVQTTLAKCVPGWRRIHGDPEPYVRKALVHESVSRWRRRRWREVSTAEPPELATRSDAVERLALLAALRELPARQRAAVVLRHVEDLGESETARLLGCSVGTVKSQTHAGLAKLRRLLDVDADTTPPVRMG